MHTRFADKYITMGLKIAYYRKKAGLTQELLAEKIGRSVNFIAQVEGTGTVQRRVAGDAVQHCRGARHPCLQAA